MNQRLRAEELTGMIINIIPNILANNPRNFGKYPSNEEGGSVYTSVTLKIQNI